MSALHDKRFSTRSSTEFCSGFVTGFESHVDRPGQFTIRSLNEGRDIPNTYILICLNRNNCSFGGEISVKDELVFFSDSPGNRVHVIDVQKQQVSTLRMERRG